MNLTSAQKQAFVKGLLNTFTPELEVTDDNGLTIRSTRYADREFILAPTFRTRRNETPQLRITPQTVQRAEGLCTQVKSIDVEFSVALAFFLNENEVLHVALVPYDVFMSRQEVGTVFSHTDNGYYLNIERFDELLGDPELIAAFKVTKTA